MTRAVFVLTAQIAGLTVLCLPLSFSWAEEARSQTRPAVESTDFADGLFSRKMYGPAISEYEKFIEMSPASAQTASARFRLADSHYFLKDYPKAVEQYDIYLKKHPQDERVPLALFRMGMAQYYRGEVAAARRVFFQIPKTRGEPNIQAGAYFYLAKIYDAEGQKDRAIFVLKKILLNYAQTEYAAYAALYVGDLFAAQGLSTEAVDMYHLAASYRESENVAREASMKIADLFFFEKKYAQARGCYLEAYQVEKAARGAPAEFAGEEKKAYFERVLKGLFHSYFYEKDLWSSKKLLSDNENFVKISQMRGDLYLLLASLAVEKKDNEYALMLLERVLSDDKTSRDLKTKALFKKSSVLNALNRKDDAIQVLNGVTEGSDKNDTTRAYYEQAEIRREAGQLSEALDAYSAVLRTSDEEPYAQNALYQSGFLRVKLKKIEEAKSDFDQYLKLYPDGESSERVLLQLAQIELDAERFEPAEKITKIFLKRFPSSKLKDVAYYKMGMALTGLERFTDAATNFLKLIEEHPSSALIAEATYAVAASFDGAGQADKAVVYYEKFTQNYPGDPLYKEALLRLGFLFVQLREYERAAVFYEDILLNKPEIPLESSVALWVIRYDLSQAHYERMKAILMSAPKRYPEEDLTHEINFFLGESLVGLKNYEEAHQYYVKSVEAKPDGAFAAHAWLGLGIISKVQGNVDKADEYLSKALGFENETDVALRARFEMANSQLTRKNVAEAAKAFMHVAILFDDEEYCPTALYKAGECFSQLGNQDEAIKALMELVNRYPKSRWAAEAAPKLSAMAEKAKE